MAEHNEYPMYPQEVQRILKDADEIEADLRATVAALQKEIARSSSKTSDGAPATSKDWPSAVIATDTSKGRKTHAKTLRSRVGLHPSTLENYQLRLEGPKHIESWEFSDERSMPTEEELSEAFAKCSGRDSKEHKKLCDVWAEMGAFLSSLIGMDNAQMVKALGITHDKQHSTARVNYYSVRCHDDGGKRHDYRLVFTVDTCGCSGVQFIHLASTTNIIIPVVLSAPFHNSGLTRIVRAFDHDDTWASIRKDDAGE